MPVEKKSWLGLIRVSKQNENQFVYLNKLSLYSWTRASGNETNCVNEIKQSV
jgi:hypothetical protein